LGVFMSEMRSGRRGLRFGWMMAATAVSLTMAANVSAQAGPDDVWTRFPAVSEVRVGVAATNLETGTYDDGKVVINGEALFGRFRPNYSDPIRQFFLNPRPHIGFSFNPHSNGVSAAYTGLTWDVNLTDKLFFETSFGGTVHNGATESYGCSVMFRESASIGYNLTEHTRIMATVDHSSNGGLCDPNKGLTNAGVRLGYRW
jgi:lipid A 3-O-deacylase